MQETSRTTSAFRPCTSNSAHNSSSTTTDTTPNTNNNNKYRSYRMSGGSSREGSELAPVRTAAVRPSLFRRMRSILHTRKAARSWRATTQQRSREDVMVRPTTQTAAPAVHQHHANDGKEKGAAIELERIVRHCYPRTSACPQQNLLLLCLRPCDGVIVIVVVLCAFRVVS